MDLEQLKLVITSMEGVVGKLSEGAVLWLGLHYIVETIKALGWILVPTITITSVVRATAASGEAAEAWKSVALQVGHDNPDLYWSASRAAVTKKLHDLLEAERELKRLAKEGKK